jgi:hypothetical protein
MKESYGEGLASHAGPESWAVAREDGGQALTGVSAGWVSSRERTVLRGADAVLTVGRQHHGPRRCERCVGPAWSKAPCMRRNTSRENREISGPPANGIAGRAGKVEKEAALRR